MEQTNIQDSLMTNIYPSLTEIGVLNPEQITRYSLQNIKNVDVLRIVYKRSKGSLLPTSKKFKFGRSQKMVVTDSGSHKTETVYEISPFLTKVIDELHTIVSHKHNRKEQLEIIEDEINRLEEETHSRVAYLKTLINNLSD
jgi:archaellum component FlaC